MSANSEVLSFLNRNLAHGCLESFGIKKQFIQLGFSNGKYEAINFFVDCEIYSLDAGINEKLLGLKEYSKDTYEIAYFLWANLKCIHSCNFDEQNNFILNFENHYSIVFDLNSLEHANLSITCREKIGAMISISVDMQFGGEIIIS